MKVAVYIGRFQPFHLGHYYAIQRGFELADEVLVLIGDTGGPRTIKNPFTFQERAQMILSEIDYDGKIPQIEPIYDQASDTDWIAHVNEVVASRTLPGDQIILIGHEKDASSYYLKYFPQWKFIDTGYESLSDGSEFAIDATQIRVLLYTDRLQYARGLVGNETFRFLSNFRSHGVYNNLVEEYKYIQAYRQSWASAPFPPIFVTVDAVVIASGHILLVRRGQNPGKGLWALPGGFVDQVEGIEHAAIRELIEETSIKLQPEVLERLITHVKVFDRRGGVGMEDRGRIITHAHLFRLDDTRGLPKVKGADDADEARWVPLHEVHRHNMFSDHYLIIDAMKNLS